MFLGAYQSFTKASAIQILANIFIVASCPATFAFGAFGAGAFGDTTDPHLNDVSVESSKHDAGFARPHTAIAMVGVLLSAPECTVRDRPTNSATSPKVHAVE